MLFRRLLDIVRCCRTASWPSQLGVVLVALVVLVAFGGTCEGSPNVKVVQGGSPIPTGLYVMVRSSQLLDPKFGLPALEKILSKRWVSAIALGVEMSDIFTDSLTPERKNLDIILEMVSVASLHAGRSEPVPIFLKFYPVLPSWMSVNASLPGENINMSAGADIFFRNKVGMLVMSRDGWVDASNHVVTSRVYPLSTDENYHAMLFIYMRFLSSWLAEVDPAGKRFPLLHVIGSSMDSNTMRPIPNSPFLVAPQRDLDKLDWNKARHIQAWISVVSEMSEQAAFRTRCWVFNLTSLPKEVAKNGMGLTLNDQRRVIDVLAAIHPLGKRAILLKTEDLTVDFNNIRGKVNNGNGIWKAQYLNSKAFPYKYIAEKYLGHGWELWASLYSGRDVRYSSLSPFNELVNNSLYYDLWNDAPKIFQGTLWVELWPEDILYPPVVGSEEFFVRLSEWSGHISSAATKVVDL